MAQTNSVDLLSAAAVLAATPVARQVAPAVEVEILDISDDSALVVWAFASGGVPMTCLVSLDFDKADPSVGWAAGWNADGDCPKRVLDEVIEAAEQRMADRFDDRDDNAEEPWERDDSRFAAYDDAEVM